MFTGDRAVRAFNRFELKYAVPLHQLGELESALSGRLAPDAHGVDGAYDVWSRYYDTADLRFYWEKIDGIKFRRKLRVRIYGDPSTITPDTVVWVEIKQRVNRVTQKRRLGLPYRNALELCAGTDVDLDAVAAATNTRVADIDRTVASEVQGMVHTIGLKPVSIVGYHRKAFQGVDADAGLRVTFDTMVRGRDLDLDLDGDKDGLSIVPAHLAIVEVKVDDRVPFWLTDLVARHDLQLVRVSKYCQSIERFGRVPRSQTLDPVFAQASAGGTTPAQEA